VVRVGIHGPNLNAALQETYEIAAKLGGEGWEMVNYTTDYLTVPGRTCLPGESPAS
jgi:hypothetical protein